jgi:hypothetical protein
MCLEAGKTSRFCLIGIDWKGVIASTAGVDYVVSAAPDGPIVPAIYNVKY